MTPSVFLGLIRTPQLTGQIIFAMFVRTSLWYTQAISDFSDAGEPIVVEIDESKFFHGKYHQGQWREGHWVFGGIECNSGHWFLCVVPDC